MDPKSNQKLFYFRFHFWAFWNHFGGPFWTPKIYRRNNPGLRKCGFTMGKLHFLQKWHDFYVNFKMHVIWMWMRFGSRLGPISNQFWNQFGVPKLPQKWSEHSPFLVPFLKPFFMRSWSSSSASWEPSWASYAHLGSLQDVKSMVFHCKMTLFENDTFWCFEALHGPLGPILAPSWPDLVPKRSRK